MLRAEAHPRHLDPAALSDKSFEPIVRLAAIVAEATPLAVEPTQSSQSRNPQPRANDSTRDDAAVGAVMVLRRGGVV